MPPVSNRRRPGSYTTENKAEYENIHVVAESTSEAWNKARQIYGEDEGWVISYSELLDVIDGYQVIVQDVCQGVGVTK